jgi:hypothetical protein
MIHQNDRKCKWGTSERTGTFRSAIWQFATDSNIEGKLEANLSRISVLDMAAALADIADVVASA